jgi:tetratricopeptide (TPR) repeat protein
LTKKAPEDVDAWVMLASLHGRKGNMNDAEDCCHKALSINPSHPTANSLLGNVHAKKGRHSEAQSCYRKALAVNPNAPGVMNNLGNALYLAGDLEEAASVLERVARLKPDYPDAHNNLGNIYKALNKNSEAIFHFKRALALNPQLLEALFNLGNIYIDRIGYPQAAEDCFRKALALEPDNPEAKAGLASMLRFQGKYEDALELINSAIERDPENYSALAGKADVLERMGRHYEAYTIIRELLESDPNNPMGADILSRLCKRYECCDEAVRLGETLIAGDTLNDTGRQTLHFSLGKLHDKLGNYDAAFEHYACGNRMAGVPFDAAGYEQKFAETINTYSKEALEHLPKAGHGDTRPVFIVGMPRSGTSLTEQILASHPQVCGAGELNDMNDIAAGLHLTLGSIKPYPLCIRDLDQLHADQLASRHLDRLDGFSSTATRITDKMPHNFVNLGLIALLFPQARIIHCRRDPRDTCLSIYFQNFGWLHPYSTDLSHLGFYYRLYHKLMQHWEAVIDLPMMTVSYEEMVTVPERISRELVNFIGLDWDDRCLRFHTVKRNVATASYDQVRQPVYTKSMARWKHYEKHIGPLAEALGDGINY